MSLSLSHRSISGLLLSVFLCLQLLAPQAAFAQGGSRTPLIGDEKVGRFWGYLGMDAGWSWLQSRVSGEADKQGIDGGVGASLNYYRKYFLWELGARLNYKQISGTRTDGTRVGVDTLSLAGEASLRFRFGEQFQFGPFFQYVFGADLSYRPTNLPILAGEGGKETLMAVGLSWVFETRRDLVPQRLGIRLLKYIDVPNRTLVGAQVTYQIGFKLFSEPTPRFIYNTRTKSYTRD